MSKAVLVMDMPCNCDECAFREYSESTQWDMCIVNNCKELGDTTKRPDWCPLKPLPEKKEVCGKYPQSDHIPPSYKIGWNAFLDAIGGET